MGRKSTLQDADLLQRICDAFRAAGYEGATLATLSLATGLQKASLYHRFPGGKEQMAAEVLNMTGEWLGKEVLQPLQGRGTPRARLEGMVARLDQFYEGGRKACLLNLMSQGQPCEGPFDATIHSLMTAWVDALSRLLHEAGIDMPLARSRAEQALISLQGSLIVSRGMGTQRPFQDFLANLPDTLLGPS